jgi:hypothetical protein
LSKKYEKKPFYDNLRKQDLTKDEIRWLIDDAYTSIPIDDTLAKFGSHWTRRMLNDYFKRNPEVKQVYEEALIASCPFLENDLLNAHKKLDHKAAHVYSANLMRILEARRPDKYGKKIDLNLNQTVSIRANIEKAETRLKNVIKDVGPSILISTAIANSEDKK